MHGTKSKKKRKIGGKGNTEEYSDGNKHRIRIELEDKAKVVVSD